MGLFFVVNHRVFCRVFTRFLFIILIITSLVNRVSLAQPRYTAVDLGTLQEGNTSSSWGFGLNDLGQVIGHSDAPNGRSIHAFLWDDGYMLDIKTLGGTYSWAYGINNRSQITGYSMVDSLTIYGYIWEDGIMEGIGGLPGSRGDFSRGNAINEYGVIAGVCHGTGGGWIVPYAGFTYDHGKWREIPTFGGDESQAFGINELGDAVGWARFAEPEPTAPRAFMFTNGGQMVDLGTLGGKHSWAEDINNKRQVVGWGTNSDEIYRAFLWDDGVLSDLGGLGGMQSWAYAVNNIGQIVGSSEIADGTKHGYLRDVDGSMWDLNDLVQPGLDVIFRGARGINELGQIVSTGVLPDDSRHAYLLTPDKMLDLVDPVPGEAGVVNTFAVTGAVAGQWVHFVYGLKPGYSEVASCGMNVSIFKPVWFGRGKADENGEVALEVFVPVAAGGKTVFFQAVANSDCTFSNLVRYIFP